MVVPALLLAAVATWPVDAGTQGALVEDHRAPAVTVVIELPVGGWSPWGRARHAAEAFEMMDRDPDRALGKRADALPVDLSLNVSKSAATMRATCLKRDLEAALGLVRDVLANARYDERELKRESRERSILWRGTETDVGFRVRQAAARSLFPAGDPRRLPYEKPEPLVTDAAKLAATRDAMIRWPGRVVGFAGDLTLEEARRAAAGLLPAPAEAAPRDLAPRFGTTISAAERPRAQDVRMRKLTQVYLAYDRESVPWDDPRRPAFLVADHVLAGHFYARLYVALRHEGGDTYGVGTSDAGDVVPGIYAASTFTRAPNAASIEAKLRETMAVFCEKGITEDERANAAGYLTGHLAFGRQAPSQILSRWLTERRFGLPPGSLEELVDRASKLSLDEINAFIRDYYDPAQFSMIRAVPE